MSWPFGLSVESFIFLVSRAPTIPELQAALDAQDFLGQLVISPMDPVEVPSDTPPLFEYRGHLDGSDLTFRIGKTVPARLPGPAKDNPGVRSWPVVLWSTNTGRRPDVVAASAMTIYAWAAATKGARYRWETGASFDLSPTKTAIDLILTRHSNRWDEFDARYPHIDTSGEYGPKPGEQGTISVFVR